MSSTTPLLWILLLVVLASLYFLVQSLGGFSHLPALIQAGLTSWQ